MVCTFLVVTLAYLLWGSEREPRCRGRTLSAWLLEGTWNPDGLSAEQEEAIRCMGTNALPFLVKWVQYVSPPWRVRLTGNAPRVFARFSFLLRDKQLERARLSPRLGGIGIRR